MLGFTNSDVDAVISGVTYLASSGFTATDVANNNDLSISNTENHGFLRSPAITESDLDAGLWDRAYIEIFDAAEPDDSPSMGTLSVKTGWLGQVTLGRGTFIAEMHGKESAYAITVLFLYTPMCRHKLGDAGCRVDMASGSTPDSPSTPFTSTVTVTSVGADGLTLGVASLTSGEGPKAIITSITNANPGIVTMDVIVPFANGDAVTVSGAGAFSGAWIIKSLAGGPTTYTWSLDTDTTDTALYPPYVSGGKVYFLDGTSTYAGGEITMTSGPNVGRSMEIKDSQLGMLTLQLPFGRLCTVGDTYTLTVGCDKTRPTCRNTFGNVRNFGGFPDVPGRDKVIQVGRPQ